MTSLFFVVLILPLGVIGAVVVARVCLWLLRRHDSPITNLAPGPDTALRPTGSHFSTAPITPFADGPVIMSAETPEAVSPQNMTTIEWPDPWRLVNARWRQYIGGELRWELSNFPDHPLANRSFQVVAMKDPYDNAIIQFDDDSFGYVKLSWGAKSPHFEPIGGEAQLVRFLRGDGPMTTETARKLIAILEDNPDRTAAMKEALLRELPADEAIFFDNAPDMVGWLKASLGTVCVLSLDHDLGPNRKREGEIFDPGVGRDVVTLLETMPSACQVIVHSSNGPAGDGMMYALEREGWSVERVYPVRDLSWVNSHWIGRIVACVNGNRSIT